MLVWVLFGAVNDSAGLALHEGAVGVQFVNDELEGTQDLSFVLRWNIFVAEWSAHDGIADKIGRLLLGLPSLLPPTVGPLASSRLSLSAC